MNGSPPPEQSDPAYRQPVVVRGGRLAVDKPPKPRSSHWLSEFLRREGMVEARGFLGRDLQDKEPAQVVGDLAARETGRKSYRKKSYGPHAIIGAAVLLSVAVAGVVAYRHVTSGQYAGQAAPSGALTALAPVQHPGGPLQDATSSGGAAEVPDFDHQPAHPLLPDLSNWPPATIASKPPTDKSSVPAPAKAPETFRAAGRLHLQIVYPPSSTPGASRIDALISGLRSQVGNIGRATVSTGPAAREIVVVYFFHRDHADARHIAVSLRHATGRHYRLMLGHEHPLPAPGTIEIKLPR